MHGKGVGGDSYGKGGARLQLLLRRGKSALLSLFETNTQEKKWEAASPEKREAAALACEESYVFSSVRVRTGFVLTLFFSIFFEFLEIHFLEILIMSVAKSQEFENLIYSNDILLISVENAEIPENFHQNT